jgi:magnesium transporter
MSQVDVKASLDESVTKHMRPDAVRLQSSQNVGEALQWLRRNPPPERIIYFFVVDGEGRLEGVVPTRYLVLSPLDRPISEIMNRHVVTLPFTATVREACEFFVLHRFLAFPVVDEERHLLGVVDVELYTDEIGHLSDADKRDDLFQAIGVYADEAQKSSPLGSFRRRFPWLGCNMAGGLACALIAGVFENLNHFVTLSLFFPVVLNLAESVASQSISLTLHLLRGREPSWRWMLEGLRQELATGLLLGSACGAVIGLIALLWRRQTGVALCLLGGIGGGVTASAVLGLALPALLRLLDLDPKVAAGPIALAAADVLTLLLYLGLASWLLGWS